MESSVYALSNRMVGQERMDQLEHFACRQLNRFSPHAGEHTLSPEPPTKEPSDADAAVTDIAEDNKAQEPEHHLEPLSIRKRKRSLSTRCREDDHKVQVPTHDENEPEENVAALDRSPSPNTTRRRWQTMLLEAGGLSAAVSEESLKSLQFCLNRLSYTTALLQDRIAFLRSFMLSLSTDPSNQDGIDPTHLETLQRIKMDLVDGVKHSVDAVSKYAGGALPDQAKQFVRKTLLSLPSRFNTSLQQQQRRPSRSDGSVSEQRQALHDAAERMLTFAVEGVDALGSVAKVFGDTIERADG